MKTEIRLFTDPEAEPITRSVEIGTDIESLVREYRSHLPHRIITAKVNGDNAPLNKIIEGPCDIVLCDIRENPANRAFQRGLILVFLKAARDVLGEVRVMIKNSINRGLYVKIDSPYALDGELLGRIEKRMWELVDENRPISMTTLSKGDLFDYLKSRNQEEEIELLKYSPDIHYMNTYELDGYSNYFYGNLPPSAGYAAPFALEPFHGGILLRMPSPQSPEKVVLLDTDDKIFEAFEEESGLIEAFGIGYIGDLDEAVDRGEVNELIETLEYRHRRKVEALAEKIIGSEKRVVLIAGPSSSGKTTFTKRLMEKLRERGHDSLYVGTDDYFFDRSAAPKDLKGRYNFEGLDALDVELFEKDMNALLAGGEVDMPRYDFLDGKKKFGERVESLKQGAVIFIEGIHALNDRLSEAIPEAEKFRVYISPLSQLNIDDHNRVSPSDVRLIRRICRDSRTRGTSAEMTLKGWQKVRDGEVVNIFPYNNRADAVFNSALAYELCVLRKYAEPLLEEIRPGDPNYGHAKWLLYLLRFFSIITDESSIPEDSLIREFIGGSKYGG